MEKIRVDSVEFCVVRSARRTVCIRVLQDGTPQILAPVGASDRELRRIAKPYTERILQEIEDRHAAEKARQEFSINYGDAVRCLGGERIISAGKDGRISYNDNSFFIPPGLCPDEIRDAVIAVYKLAAKNYIKTRVEELAPLLGLDVRAVRINSATSHWASCSRKNTLNFSWFCIMAESAAIDYIIIHELCHMYEFNHSKKFWTMVENFCTDYKRQRAYLKKLWKEISKENWKQAR